MKLWQICLALWFALYAIVTMTSIQVKALDILMGILAALVTVFLFAAREKGLS